MILAKRLSETQKILIVEKFTDGKTIDELANDFDCTKLTITRNLKKRIDEKKFKALFNQNKITKSSEFEKQSNTFLNKKNNNDFFEEESNTFTELAPLDYKIDNTTQKDLSSVPVSDVNFPKMVFMIVNSKIELETKYLREYPDWQFLSDEELNRKTIEIHNDLKIAKRLCNKEQKVIKVPNSDVFKIVAPLLLSRGISRIVSTDKLIAL